MPEALTGLLVLLSVSVVSAVAWHWRVARYPRAAVGGASTAAAAFQVLAALHAGYFDPFWPIALVISFFPALIVSLLVGLPWRARHESR